MTGDKKVEPLLEEPLVSFGNPSRPQFYMNVDYLMWWVHRAPTPALLTTAPNNGLNANGLTGGILEEPGTTALFTNLDYRNIPGMRFGAGVNLGDDRFWGLEAGGFFLKRKTIDFARAGAGDGTPLLKVPFLDAATGKQSALTVNAQDNGGNPLLSGRMNIDSEIQLWGYDLNLVAHSIQTPERVFDCLVGFRAGTLDEQLAINQNLTALQNGAVTFQFPTVGQGTPYYSVPAGGSVAISDQFTTRNRFYGGQVGGRFGWNFGSLTVDLTSKIAVGATEQQVTINGLSTVTSATLAGKPSLTNATTPGGVFALQNNIGTYNQTQFTVIPEVNLDLNYAITNWLFIRLGYSALYWSNVARPGAQIDPVLNSKLIPTAPLLNTVVGSLPQGAFIPGQEQGRPYFNFRDTSFWAHGINVGLEVRY